MIFPLKKKVLISMLMMFLIFSISITQNIAGSPSESDETTSLSSDPDIVIPDDYPTIQEGIDNAEVGDKIFVRSRSEPYYENIVVDKERLLIRGEDKNNTVIDAGKTMHDAVAIPAEGVTIENFTVTGARCKNEYIWNQAGIKIYSSNVTIKNSKLVDNQIGIEVYSKAYNLTIVDNEFYNDGILLGNYLSSKEPSLTMQDYIHNIKNNTVMGQPLYYYTNKNDFAVPNNAGLIILVNCTNVTIRDLYMSRNDFSIILAYCSNCLIENLTISDTDGEVLLFECDNNTITHNTISNTMKAICLEYNSKNNNISYNDVSHNYVGISLYSSAKNNTVYKNKAYKNKGFGMEIVSYNEGTIQQDNIVSENHFYKNKVGIYLTRNSIKNIIENNSITYNKVGILLQKSSDYNKIMYNNFKWNLLPATFIGCTKNTWYKNYWNRPRLLPKPIFGYKLVGKVPIPCIDFDRNPAKNPIV